MRPQMPPNYYGGYPPNADINGDMVLCITCKRPAKIYARKQCQTCYKKAKRFLSEQYTMVY
jgi:hypothetical protein